MWCSWQLAAQRPCATTVRDPDRHEWPSLRIPLVVSWSSCLRNMCVNLCGIQVLELYMYIYIYIGRNRYREWRTEGYAQNQKPPKNIKHTKYKRSPKRHKKNTPGCYHQSTWGTQLIWSWADGLRPINIASTARLYLVRIS